MKKKRNVWKNREMKLTAEDILDILHKVRDDGYTVTEIATFYDISRSYASKLLANKARKDVERPKLDTNKFGRKVTLGKAKKIIKMREQGLLIKDIAAYFKLSVGSIRNVINGTKFPELDRSNIKADQRTQRTYKHQRISKDLAQKICEEVDTGVTQRSVAHKYGVTTSYVCKIVHGRVYDDVFVKGMHYKSAPVPIKAGKTKELTREQRRDQWKIRQKGMMYNSYGMLVPIDYVDEEE